MTSLDEREKALLIRKLGLVLENGRWFSKKENSHPALVFTEHYVQTHDVLALLFRCNKLCLGKLKYYRAHFDEYRPYKYDYEKGFVATELWDAEFFRHERSGRYIDFRFLQTITVYEDFVAFCKKLEAFE